MLLTPAPSPARALALAAALVVAAAPAARAQVCEDTQVYLTDVTRTNYSLGYENFKNRDYCAALPYLRWIVRHEPLFTSEGVGDDRNFRRLMDTYEALAGMAADSVTKGAYLDSVLVTRELMRQALAAGGVPYDSLAQSLSEGRFYAQHPAEYPVQQGHAFDLFIGAFRMAPDSLDDYYLNEIGRMAVLRAAEGAMTPAEAHDLVAELIPYATDAAYLEGVAGTFLVDPYDQWADAYAAYRAGDRSEGTVTVVFAGTTQIDSLIAVRMPEVDLPALRQELYPLLLEFNPTPGLLVLVGATAIEEGRTEEGLDYFRRAVDLSATDVERRDTHYHIAGLLYRAGRFEEAYEHAGEALALSPDFGGALYIRALIVASSLRNGSVAERAGAWCVADMFSRAAETAEGEQAERARQYATQYLEYAPTASDYASLGWEPGQQITAETGYGSCSTTVR